MTQLDVKEWLEINCGCDVYKERVDANGDIFYSMRKGDSKKPVIVYPVKNGIYKPSAVKAICIQLGVEIPDYGKVED